MRQVCRQGSVVTIIVILVCLLSLRLSAYAADGRSVSRTVARTPTGFDDAPFSGEILPVFYVRDVLRSVAFYVDTLGFVCDHFFDHINGGSVTEWTYDAPPVYAEMRAGSQIFALHRASQPDSLIVGGTRVYFAVTDVRAHRRTVISKGLKVGELVERSWMDMYRVVDPDGHELYIFTRPPGWED